MNFCPHQKFSNQNEMKPLGIDRWWIIKTKPTIIFDWLLKEEVFQRFLASLTKTENQDSFSHKQIRIYLSWRVSIQPWDAILHYTNTQEERRTRKSGIDLNFGDHTTSFAIRFWFTIFILFDPSFSGSQNYFVKL